MNSFLSITNKASDQIKKILQAAPKDVDSIVVGIDKSGCSGFSYKIDFATSSKLKNFDFIDNDGLKVFVDPKASMFLSESEAIVNRLLSVSPSPLTSS